LWTTVCAAAATAGRDHNQITPGLMATITLDADVTRARAELNRYVHAFYGFPLEAVSTLQACYAGTADGCLDWLRSYWHAGARHILLRLGGLDGLAQLDRAARHLLDEIRRW
jgi:alkanesulfonate monooxygenase SsuD/methylene tetrahydromethanopterin reductase-like flavin-dependent oxidoreductase (luciferase family)